MAIDALLNDDAKLDRLHVTMNRLTDRLKLERLHHTMDQLTDRLAKMTRPANSRYSSHLRSHGPPFRPPRHQSAPPRFRPFPQRPQTDPARPRTSAAEPPRHQPSQHIPRADSRDRPTGPCNPPTDAEPPRSAYTNKYTSTSRVPRIPSYRWAPDGRPICARCGKVGHIYRQCLEN